MISVIIPVYKAELYIARCIDSMLNQTYQDFELILVDDGSPDRSGEICDEYAANHKQIHVVHQRNSGVSAARNAGLLIAEGEWVLFIDADDYVSPYLLELMIRNAQDEKRLVASGFTRKESELLLHNPDELTVANSLQHHRNLRTPRHAMFVWAVLYNRSVIIKNQLRFDEKMGNLEDVVWNVVYQQYIDEVLYVDLPLYLHYVNSESITSRCIDHQWQCQSWVNAYSSIIAEGKRLNLGNKDDLRKEMRSVLNNVYAELKLLDRDSRYKVLNSMMRNAGISKFNHNYFKNEYEPRGAYFFHKFCPWLEYSIYMLLLNIKEKLAH